MYIYSKHAYFFHNEFADSSEPQWEQKLFYVRVSDHLF